MQEATGEIKQFNNKQLEELVKKEGAGILTSLEETEVTIDNSLKGFTPLSDREHKAMLELPISDRPSELAWSRYQDNIPHNQWSDVTLGELFTDGFKAARKIYEGK